MEFSKRLSIILIVFGMLGVIASYVLAFLGKETNYTVTVSLITEIMVTGIAYLTYQYKLKDSRNKHGVDEEGVPYDLANNIK